MQYAARWCYNQAVMTTTDVLTIHSTFAGKQCYRVKRSLHVPFPITSVSRGMLVYFSPKGRSYKWQSDTGNISTYTLASYDAPAEFASLDDQEVLAYLKDEAAKAEARRIYEQSDTYVCFQMRGRMASFMEHSTDNDVLFWREVEALLAKKGYTAGGN